MADQEHQRHHEGHQDRHERVHADLESARIQRLEETKRESAHERDDRQERVEQAREAILGPKQAEHEKHEQEKHEEVETEETKEKAEVPKTEEQILEEPKVSMPMLSPKLNYQHTMKTVQHQLDPLSRSFSKFIHTPIVEKTSEVLENTLVRPSVAVGATWTALIVGTTFYLVARHYGYQLSGSELIFSFIVGAFVGLLIEGLVFMFRRRQ